ncbi:hypothetical protein EON64_03605, partial [archaeon]
SGKTECCKLILNSLGGRRATDHTHVAWFNNLLLANKILESFGAARTLKTANSSRFGKLIELKLNGSGDLVSSSFKTYLLESSRTSNQQLGERNFNVFYQLIAGASSEEARKWRLRPAEDFVFINQGGVCHPKGKRDDALKFKELREGLARIGLAAEVSAGLFDLLAGVLALGQIVFEALDDMSGGCRVVDAELEEGPLQTAASLLGLPRIQLEELLTMKVMNTRGEAIKRKLPETQAIVARDAVAKALYKTVFDWVVAFVNGRLVASQPPKTDKTESHTTITVVDIFGMDSLAHNSLDQLCINYANEALHQFFNHHMFKLESELYSQEGIDFQRFDFPDNQENLVLIGNGIFKILDDQCKLPNPTDKRLAAQLYKEYSNHPLFTVSTFQQQENKFTIVHFAGPVEYTVNDFILKNLDNLPAGTNGVIASSSNEFLISAVHNNTSGGSKRRGTITNSTAASNTHRVSAPSFVAQVKMDLTLLLKEIESTKPHYVKCFKPYDKEIDSAEEIRNRTLSMAFSASNIAAALAANAPATPQNARNLPPLPKGAKKEVPFSQTKVAEQLKYSGILDAVRIGRVGFRTRMPFVEFYNRYRVLANELIGVTYNGPRSIRPDIDVSEARRFSKELLDALSSTKQVVESVSLDSRGILARSASMNQILKEAKMNALNGVIDGANVQFGTTLIFMHKKEHDVLESLRNSNLRAYVILIQKNYRSHYALLIFRRRLRSRQRAVVTLQRKFRALRFYFRIVALQCLIRRFVACRKLEVVRERKRRLVALYGPLIQSREMRLKRRRDFVDQPKESTRGILVPEIRVAEFKIREEELVREILELVAESKLSDSAEFDFYKLIDILSARIKALKNNEFKIAMIQFIRSLIPAEHLLRTWELTNNTVIGNLVGPLVWKLFYKGDIPEVHVNKRHQIFLPVDRMLQKIKHITSLTDKQSQDLELQRSKMRQYGVTRNASSARRLHSDAMINKINAQIHNMSKIQNLLSMFNKYYTTFIGNFTFEYGENSAYHKTFTKEKEYVKDLLLVVEKMQTDKPLRNTKEGDTLYSVNKCRLKVEWKETLENMRQLNPEANQTRRPVSQYFEDNDLLRKISDLERTKKDFAKDSLRIVEHNNVGYQFNPHSPGVSFAINSLFNLLCERFLPPRRLIKLTGARQLEGKVAYYQAAPFMSSASLLDVLYNPVSIEQLDSKTFSAAVFTCLLLNLTNLYPSHVLANLNKQPKSMRASLARDTSLNVYGFNSDALLQACFLDFLNPIRSKLHGYNLNVLFFLPQMDEPVDPDIRTFLTSSPFVCEEVIMSWLRDIHEQNARFEMLRASGFTPADFKALNLPVQLSKGSVVEVYRRMKLVIELILSAAGMEGQQREHAEEGEGSRRFSLTLQDFLNQTYPNMADFYADKRLNSDFTEGIDFDGVVSYAFVYHQALELERERALAAKRGRVGSSTTAGNMGSLLDDSRAVDTTDVTVSVDRGVEEQKQQGTNGVFVTPVKSNNRDSLHLDEDPIRMEDDDEHSEDNDSVGAKGPKPVLITHPSVRLSYANIYDEDASNNVVYEAPPTPFKKIQSNMVLRTSMRSIPKSPSRGGVDLGYDNIFGGGSDLGATDNMTFMSAPVEFRKIVGKKAVSNDLKHVDVDGNKVINRMMPLSETIEDEALDFMTHLDFRHYAEIKPVGRAVEFCELVGKNLAFMPSLWFNHIAEWQLKAIFGFWLRLEKLGSLGVSRLKLKTSEIILRYDSEEDMQQMKDCRLLVKLQKRLKITVKFAVLTTSVDALGNSVVDSDGSKLVALEGAANDAGQPPRHLIKLTSDITFTSSLSYNFGFFRRDYLYDRTINPANRSDAQLRQTNYRRWELENYATWNKALGRDHNVTLLVGQGAEQQVNNGTSANANGIPFDAVQIINLVPSGPNLSVNTTFEDRSRASYFARAGYEFKGKYGIDLSFRRDASSRYSPGSRWGTFPAASARWTVSDEPFFDRFKNTVSFLKIRGSYGVTGRDPGSYYAQYRLLGTGINYPGSSLGLGASGNVITYNGTTGVTPNYGSPAPASEITWERSPQMNIGLDMNFLKDRFT